jgi:hypothetical protein
MCDPLSITALALSAGGAAAQSVAASKAASARNDALAAERIRQNAFDQQAAAVNTQAQDRYQGFGDQQEERTAQLGDYFAGQAAPEQTAAPASMPVSTSNITVREEGKQRDAARDYTDNQARALGDLRAFGDLFGTIGRGQARDAGTLGQIANFKQGQASILPLTLDAAASAGSGYDTFGRILSGLGSVAGMAGASGVNPFAPMRGAVTAAQSNPARLGTLY